MKKKKNMVLVAAGAALFVLALAFLAVRPAYALFTEDTVDKGGGGNPTASIVREDGRNKGSGSSSENPYETGIPGETGAPGETGTPGEGEDPGNGGDPSGEDPGTNGDPMGDDPFGDDPADGPGAPGGDGPGSGESGSGSDGPGGGGNGSSTGDSSGNGTGDSSGAGDGNGASDGTGPASGEGAGNGVGTADTGRPGGENEDGRGSLLVEDPDSGVSFLIPEKDKNAFVGEDFDASFGLSGAREEDILSVRVNGEEIPYSFEDGRIRIDGKDLPDGKVRVQVSVRDGSGEVREMEPWEFYRGDLYEGGPYGTMSADTQTDGLREEDGTYTMKRKTAGIIIASLVLLMTLAAIVLSVLALRMRAERERKEAELAETEAISELPEETAVPEPVETETPATPTLIPTLEPTETPTPEPTPTPTPEPKIGEGKIVCIDPGHQAQANLEQEPIGPGASETKYKVSGGTSGAASGLVESELVLEVSLKLRAELEERGYTVVMTRETQDVDISNSERAQAAADANADVFVRVHANGSDNAGMAGALTYQPTENNPFLTPEVIAESRRLSETVLRCFIEATGANDLGIISGDNMSGINWSSVPVTIVELGFMTNPDEDLLMASPEYQEKMVKGIADGIDAFFTEAG